MKRYAEGTNRTQSDYVGEDNIVRVTKDLILDMLCSP